MIRIQARLYCDACRSQFVGLASGEEGIRRTELERLRIVARATGWKRCRPSVVAEMADRCPACAALADRLARMARTIARGGRHGK